MKTVPRLRELITGIVLSATLPCGCATNYYGYTAGQWRTLNPAEREAAIREFDAILKAKRQRTHELRFIDPIKQTIIDRGIEESAP